MEAVPVNILICDDMKNEADKLTGILRDLGFEPIVFSSSNDALIYFRSGAAADVCFLDIVMPEMNGIALAEKLRADGFAGEIVFLTNSNDYAHQSYKVNAFSYLLKPPTPESVATVLDDLESARKSADKDGISIKTTGAVRFILFRNISHAEVIDHTVYIRLINGSEIPVYAKLSEIAETLLKDRRFVQCHRSYIVNMSDIGSYANGRIVMQGGAVIPISRGYADIKDRLLIWMFGRDKNGSANRD
jgi:DNA-binding LytR/AlgR family response regulator